MTYDHNRHQTDGKVTVTKTKMQNQLESIWNLKKNIIQTEIKMDTDILKESGEIQNE